MQPSRDNELIHYGCGPTAPAGWRNFDGSPTVRAKRMPGIGLLLAGFGTPFPKNVEFGDAAVKFVRDTLMGQEARSAGLFGMLRESLGNSAHRWLLDYKSRAAEPKAAGFVDIRRAEYGDNPDLAPAAVEDESRWTGSLGIECRKP